MAYKITDECLACGACLSACPAAAIQEGDVFSINSECIDCGACVGECPAGAIVQE